MLDYREFRQVLINFSMAIDNQPKPSAHKNAEPRPREVEANTIDFWLSNETNEAPLTNRTIAFVFAYVAVFGDTLSARGGALTDQSYVQWDKGIMKKLLKDGYLTLEDGAFRFTAKGQDEILRRNR